MKKWYLSKTLWLNVIGIVAIIFTGKEIDPTISGSILAVLNMILRLITKEPISW